MDVSAITYLIVVLFFFGLLGIVAYKRKDYISDKEDLFAIIGCILFWPFIVSVLLVTIVVFLLYLPFMLIYLIIKTIKTKIQNGRAQKINE